ncbi:SIP domain-containing protein [Bdellovibrio sp. NC01]|uniref:SIP domain-containing protein n=1 Tax=Bdellovibrio sp. NC01 TaxID=2220073 RepID=UPI001158D071|nr:SIP domain-containing protein [Bdellovibrio sp. NC01]QDK37577.1 hypothetical protein DOE51_08255 [Bdellovibrio sp. NC01]
MQQKFDWYLLVGDQAATSLIEDRLKQLPAHAQSVVIIENDTEALKNKVLKAMFPHGDYFTWIACDPPCAVALKDLLVTVKGSQEEWIETT